MKGYFFLIPLLFVFLLDCSGNSQKPEDLIPEDTYIDLLVELQLVRSYGELNFADSLTVDSLANEVFKRYEVTDSLFRQSHQYYQQQPQEHELRLEKAIEQLKMDQVQDRDTTSQN